MRTIDALEKEIGMQLDLVARFIPPRPIPVSRQSKSIFCGAGDSFASSLLAEAFSLHGTRAYDPLDLLKNKRLLAGRDLYLVSVSGNTSSNIKVALVHRRAVAITANTDSRLALACARTIPLKFNSTGLQTAGSISFLASVLTCICLVSGFRPTDAERLYRRAQREARNILLRGKVFILGNLHTLPVAMFCAAKMYEVLGLDAHYERIEQFSHMELFSARRGDTVIVFEQRNMHNERLVKTLGKCGISAKRVEPGTRCPYEQVLFFIFLSEFLALYGARRKKRRDCFFVEENKLQRASSSMIY